MDAKSECALQTSLLLDLLVLQHACSSDIELRTRRPNIVANMSPRLLVIQYGRAPMIENRHFHPCTFVLETKPLKRRETSEKQQNNAAAPVKNEIKSVFYTYC